MKKTTFVLTCLLGTTSAFAMDQDKPKVELKKLVIWETSSCSIENPLIHLGLQLQKINTSDEITDLTNTILYASGDNIPDALNYINTNPNGDFVSLIVLDNANHSAIQSWKSARNKPIVILVNYDEVSKNYDPLLYAGIKQTRFRSQSTSPCTLCPKDDPLNLSFLQDITNAYQNPQPLTTQETNDFELFFAIHDEPHNRTPPSSSNPLDALLLACGIDRKIAGAICIVSLAILYATYNVIGK